MNGADRQYGDKWRWLLRRFKCGSNLEWMTVYEAVSRTMLSMPQPQSPPGNREHVTCGNASLDGQLTQQRFHSVSLLGWSLYGGRGCFWRCSASSWMDGMDKCYQSGSVHRSTRAVTTSIVYKWVCSLPSNVIILNFVSRKVCLNSEMESGRRQSTLSAPALQPMRYRKEIVFLSLMCDRRDEFKPIHRHPPSHCTRLNMRGIWEPLAISSFCHHK